MDTLRSDLPPLRLTEYGKMGFARDVWGLLGGPADDRRVIAWVFDRDLFLEGWMAANPLILDMAPLSAETHKET